LVEIGEDDIYNRVYSYPKILKLIETSYLAITVIDRETGAVVGFAAFEDFPQVSNSYSAHLTLVVAVPGPGDRGQNCVATLAVRPVDSAESIFNFALFRASEE
jgi:Domain of unknown function (DUF4821)